MARIRYKFARECRGCGKQFHPEGKRNFYCERCVDKSYACGMLGRLVTSLRRVLVILRKDKDKEWYNKFENAINELLIIVKNIKGELKRKK